MKTQGLPLDGEAGGSQLLEVQIEIPFARMSATCARTTRLKWWGEGGAEGNYDNFYVAPPMRSFRVAPEVHISRFGWRFGAIWGGRTCNPLMPVQSKQLFSVFGKVVSREAPGRDICDFGADLASKYVRMGRGSS